MSLRSLQLRPISTSHYYISGDVTIEPGVAIAPGVLLQADADSRILIKAGACIGIGAIVHAHNGVVEIGTGANIGAETLLIGQVQVGANACIGAATTVFNSVVEPGQMIPPGSLIQATNGSIPTAQPPALQATNTVIYPDAETASDQSLAAANGDGLATPDAQPSNVNVYGQVYVNRMFFKLFPTDRRSNENTPADPWDD